MNKDIFFMIKTLKIAKKAFELKEVPVGAIVVKKDKIISAGINLREKKQNSLYHAEVLAINIACKKLESWRLKDCTLYVTLEPCPMCAGSIINSRIDRVVFGAYDPKAGAFGSVINFAELPFNHKPEIVGGILEEESKSLLQNFFKNLRNNKGSPTKP